MEDHTRQSRWLARVRPCIRRLGLGPAASWAARQVRRTRWGAAALEGLMGDGPLLTDDAGPVAEVERPGTYDVICLPAIAADSRCQRPERPLAQLAAAGHRVYQATLACRRDPPDNVSAVPSLGSGLFEMVLPATTNSRGLTGNSRGLTAPGNSPIDIRPLSPGDVQRMAAAVDQVRVSRRIASAVVVAQSPFWTPLAERLREQFGWPTLGGVPDDGGDDRGEALDRAIRGLFPLASIVIVTYNNLALNRQCLESIFAATDWPNFEVITVDNASRDGTPEWLTRQAAQEPRLRVFLNAENRGYAGGNNQGLQAARGEYLCLLNNDTLVTHGWLSTLIGHLRRMPPVGLIGPVSNMVGNEAKIPVGYRSIADMPRWAAAYCRDHDGETMAMPTLAFFCVLLRREVYATVGPLDSRFGLGFFEDDDYCRRAAEHGYQLCTARDAFVHHWQGASFGLLGKAATADIFHVNKRLFEKKWATKWAAPREGTRE